MSLDTFVPRKEKRRYWDFSCWRERVERRKKRRRRKKRMKNLRCVSWYRMM